jgi:hypothetical protein
MPTTPHTKNRLGLHYFPDTDHYSRQELERWLPVFTRIGISWLTLISPLERAIPEDFIRGLVQAQIQPIIQFFPPLGQTQNLTKFTSLFRIYADWGIKYVAPYERPNLRAVWQSNHWAQASITDLFIDTYIPTARRIMDYGMQPVFPPMEPGGDFWDLAFLRLSLEALIRRKEDELLHNLILGAYGYTNPSSWFWGAGGQEKWPSARPYNLSMGSEDHRGFYIFDWYNTISQAVLDRPLPMLLLRAGHLQSPLVMAQAKNKYDEIAEIWFNLSQNQRTTLTHPIPENLLGCCFWLLSSEKSSRYVPSTLYYPDGLPTTSGNMLEKIARQSQQSIIFDRHQNSNPPAHPLNLSAYPITNYVLLPNNGFPNTGSSTPHLQKLLKAKKVVFGTSLLEASLARRVILIGNARAYGAQQLTNLQRAGCEIIGCEASGIELARLLATL